MDLRAKIIGVMEQVSKENNTEFLLNKGDQTVLLESGLDSLGFAIVVATLEEQLDFDPFTIMTEPVYPRTLKEFIDIYDRIGRGCGKL